ncbi:MAG: hypothetical protein HUJ96_02155 [Marinilabiliaceae bacterium]|nr:hypothetical protein [Marinilabiliaceae bacterium]
MNGLERFIRIIKGPDFKTFIVFVVVASFFWMIEQLRRDYNMPFQLRLKCENTPDNYILGNSDQIPPLRVMVECDGFSLLYESLWSQSDSVIVDVSKLPKEQFKRGTYAIFNALQHHDEIVEALPDHFQLRSIMSDSLHIRLLTTSKKLLPVIACTDIELERQHIFSAPTMVIPEMVWVSGTNDIVDTMTAVYTKKNTHFSLHDTISLSLEFNLPPRVETSLRNAEVTFYVEPYTEKTLDIPIAGINVPAGYNFKSFPHFAHVTFGVGMSQFEKVNESDIDIIADLSTVDINGNTEQKVKLRLAQVPKNIHNISYTPLFVEFLLEKQ